MGGVAHLLFPPSPHYRRDDFAAGLQAAGWAVSGAFPTKPGPDTTLVIWNRHGENHKQATRIEREGGRVLVVENGYLGGKSKFDQYFALAIGGHNGTGKWATPQGGLPERWDTFGIELAPWRERGEHVLLLPQRGIGPDGTRMPPGWMQRVAGQLKGLTSRPIRIRRHPGVRRFEVPMGPDLLNCHCAITWASGAALKAIVAGVPVFYELPGWIGGLAASRFNAGESLETPFTGDRLPMLKRLAWAQWRIEEIRCGRPFHLLLNTGCAT